MQELARDHLGSQEAKVCSKDAVQFVVEGPTYDMDEAESCLHVGMFQNWYLKCCPNYQSP